MLKVKAKLCKMKLRKMRPACSSQNSSQITCQTETYTAMAKFRSCLYHDDYI